MVGQERAPSDPGDRAADRARTSVALLRVGLGLVWLANCVYILDPANVFFASFSGVAQSFGASSAGGPGLAELVSQYAFLFSILIAAVTVSLAVAFLSDVGVRAACVVGAAFNAALLLSQWGQIATIPGGTDIGPQPLYLIGYAVVFVGYRAGDFSLATAVRSGVARWRSHRMLPTRAPRGA
jgi:uncharacterized membrane protein YphA (DoxX/SURF4 family)